MLNVLHQILGAIDGITRGKASVFGEDLGTLTGMARTRFRREKVGFVFQQFHLVPTLTALQRVSKLAKGSDLVAQSSPVVLMQGVTFYKNLLGTLNPPGPSRLPSSRNCEVS